MLYLPAVMHQPPDPYRRPVPPRLPPALLRGGVSAARAVMTGILLLLAAVQPRPAAAHEIPTRVAVRAYVVPRDTVLTVLVRVPLEAMRDMIEPTRPDGSLDLVAVRELLPGLAKTWIADAIALRANGESIGTPRVLQARLALPSDPAFDAYESARASFFAPLLDNRIAIPWQQPLLDVWLQAPIPAADARLALNPALARLGVRTTSVVHLVLPSGATHSLSYDGDPGVIALDPAWWQSGGRFLADGFRHILGGFDHLLFVFCLVLPIRRWRPLLALVTSFTVAHSVTLGAAALGVVPRAAWFPPLVELLIAASIVWLTVENVLLPAERLERRWRVAFAFGLIHGFGFSFALGEQLQFAGGNLLTALASFNIGVEAGQLLVVALLVPVLGRVMAALRAERRHLAVWVGSALVAHEAWHWMTARFGTLIAYDLRVALPAADSSLALGLIRLALLFSVTAVAALAVREVSTRLLRPD